VLLVADDPRPEALLEQVPLSAMPAVEPLGVQAVQPVHHRGQLLTRALDDQVVVRSEHRPGDEAHTEQVGGLIEQVDEGQSIDVVEKHEPAAGSPRTDVEEPIREPGAGSTRHGYDGRAGVSSAPAIVMHLLQGLSLGGGR
jgi:hypothetical protein